MKRKRLLLIVGCLVAFVLGFGIPWLTAPRFTRENIHAIQIGMTEQQVNSVLGTKAELFPSERTRYGNRGTSTGVSLFRDPLARDAGQLGKEWLGEKISVFVWFDEAGRVVQFTDGIILEDDESFLTKLRRWLGM
jgi:hypothetical protein